MDGGAANGPVTQECNSSLMCKTFLGLLQLGVEDFHPIGFLRVWAQKVPLWP